MMYPRLKLLQKLLADDGVIFISIDDNEQAQLKLLMDEIFSEDNFIMCMPRITKKKWKKQRLRMQRIMTIFWFIQKEIRTYLLWKSMRIMHLSMPMSILKREENTN